VVVDEERSPADATTPPRGPKALPWAEAAKTLLASGLGLGLSPLAPGTLAALLGVALDVGVTVCLQGVWPRLVLLVALLAVSAGNHWLTPFAVRRWKKADPRQFVLDEVAGYLAVAVLFRAPPHAARIVLGFALVRLIDIVKVPPARYVDRNMHGATGILLDDLIAAVYAALLLYLGWWASAALGLR
jgi:phosphatidylglycerophosphatase A